MVYQATIQEDPETGDAIIELPPELIEQMGLVEGDELVWETVNEKSFLIKKK